MSSSIHFTARSGLLPRRRVGGHTCRPFPKSLCVIVRAGAGDGQDLELRMQLEALMPAFILVEPQIGENIGAAARAMKNFGLSDLRLVRPRDGWPNPAAAATASHAADLLATARLYGSVEEAVADLDRVYAATARTRFMHKAFVTSRQLPRDLCQLAAPAAAAAVAMAAAAEAAAAAATTTTTTTSNISSSTSSTSTDGSTHDSTSIHETSGAASATTLTPPAATEPAEPTSDTDATRATSPPQASPSCVSPSLSGMASPFRAPRAGIMFGRENSGLTNEEVAMANKVLTIEADPTYPVLNLGQAIVCTAYELFHARLDAAGVSVMSPPPPPQSPQSPLGMEPQQQQHPREASGSRDGEISSGSDSSSSSNTTGSGCGSGAEGSSISSSSNSSNGSSNGRSTSTSIDPGAGTPLVASSAEELRQRAAALDAASRGELDSFLSRLLAALDSVSFFESAEKRPATVMSIRNLASKVEGMSRGEVALLHGMLSKLTAQRKQ